MTILDTRITYKPFAYPWAFELYEMQQKMHWLPNEVSLADDIKDYAHNLSPSEKNLIDNIFRFFTQSDIEVTNAYLDLYMPKIKHPELRMMFTAFANMECIHTQSYALLLDTLGIPQSEYSAFLEYSEIKEKYEFLHQFKNDTIQDLAIAVGVYGGLIEGLSLFSMFAMLLNFQRFGKMKGMCQIVAFSIKDETLHVRSMARLFKEMVKEFPEVRETFDAIRAHCYMLVEHEDKFIDLAFGLGEVPGLTPKQMKDYIRYTADFRLKDLGLEPIYGVKKNPLEWYDEMISAPEFTNFFDQRVTEYAKSNIKGGWDDDVFN